MELTAEEEAELTSSMAYQSKIREGGPAAAVGPRVKSVPPPGGNAQANGSSQKSGDALVRAASAPAFSASPSEGSLSEKPNPVPSADGGSNGDGSARYMAGLTTDELCSELSSMRAMALLCDTKLLPGHRPSHLGLHSSADGLMVFKETTKRRRGRTEERWASSGGRKGARDMIFASVIMTSGNAYSPPSKQSLETPKHFASTNSKDPAVVDAAHLALNEFGPIVPAPAEMVIGNMDAVMGTRAPRRQYGSKKAEENVSSLLAHSASAPSLAGQAGLMLTSPAPQAGYRLKPPDKPAAAGARAAWGPNGGDDDDAVLQLGNHPLDDEGERLAKEALDSGVLTSTDTADSAPPEPIEGSEPAKPTAEEDAGKKTAAATSGEGEGAAAAAETTEPVAETEPAKTEPAAATDPELPTATGTPPGEPPPIRVEATNPAAAVVQAAAPPSDDPPARAEAANPTAEAETAAAAAAAAPPSNALVPAAAAPPAAAAAAAAPPAEDPDKPVVVGVRRRYGKILYPVTGDPRGERFHQYNLLVVVRTPTGIAAIAEQPLPILYHVYPSGSLKKSVFPEPQEEPSVEVKYEDEDGGLLGILASAGSGSGRATKRKTSGGRRQGASKAAKPKAPRGKGKGRGRAKPQANHIVSFGPGLLAAMSQQDRAMCMDESGGAAGDSSDPGAAFMMDLSSLDGAALMRAQQHQRQQQQILLMQQQQLLLLQRQSQQLQQQTMRQHQELQQFEHQGPGQGQGQGVNMGVHNGRIPGDGSFENLLRRASESYDEDGDDEGYNADDASQYAMHHQQQLKRMRQGQQRAAADGGGGGGRPNSRVKLSDSSGRMMTQSEDLIASFISDVATSGSDAAGSSAGGATGDATSLAADDGAALPVPVGGPFGEPESPDSASSVASSEGDADGDLGHGGGNGGGMRGHGGFKGAAGRPPAPQMDLV